MGQRPVSPEEVRISPAPSPGDSEDGPADRRSASGPADHANSIDPSGLEREDDSSEITEPFKPENIKVSTTTILVDQIITRLRHREIDLSPDFQRLEVWTDTQRSRLIESLLLRIPIPVFYVSADERNNWSVVDGVQRMSTVKRFLDDQDFTLEDLEYLQRFNGNRYSDLPRAMQRRISETQFLVHVIEPTTPKDVMFNIFLRLNTGGTTLTKQEIRHAVHAGPARDFLKRLAESGEFKRATAGSVSPKRMADRELVLRFLAFYMEPWEEYEAGDLDGYLGRAMASINEVEPTRREELESVFRKSMTTAAKIFGNDAFRKRFAVEDGRHGINRALFESWAVGLARRSSEQLDQLVEKRQRVVDGFRDLLNRDGALLDAVSYATGTAAKVQRRFRTIDALIEECL